MANLEQRVQELLETKIQELGYELYDVEYAKEGPNYFLRIFIDQKKGIDLNDCENVSNAINPILDKADFIKAMYFLEVSSPGVERVIRKEKHLQSNIGNKVEVHLFKNRENQKIWMGTLKEYSLEEITLQLEEKEIIIPRNEIAIMKTIYDW